MPDWITKVFASIVSVKTAAIALFASIGLVMSWKEGFLFIKNSGVPDDYASFLLVIAIYSCSHVAVEVLMKAGAAMRKLLSIIKQLLVGRVSLHAFKQLVERSLPQLPKSQIELLKSLCESERTYDIRTGGVIDLEKQKYIKRIHKVSSTSFIFEINKTVKPLLIVNLALDRKTRLDDFVLKLTEDEKTFLELFFSETVTEGTSESGMRMGNSIFRAGENMAQNLLLVHTSEASSKEIFRLIPDTADHLKNVIFNREPKRLELHLNSAFISGSGSSGGGAIGSRHIVSR